MPDGLVAMMDRLVVRPPCPSRGNRPAEKAEARKRRRSIFRPGLFARGGAALPGAKAGSMVPPHPPGTFLPMKNRKSVAWGKGSAVRYNLGGRRYIKKKKNYRE